MDHLRADARRNRDRLLSVAGDAFRRDGIAGSLDEIARSAGVGIGTLYRHFPTRNDLVAALVQVDLERVAELADALCADESSDVLARWIDELVRHTVVYRGLAETVAATSGDASTFGRGVTQRDRDRRRRVRLIGLLIDGLRPPPDPPPRASDYLISARRMRRTPKVTGATNQIADVRAN
jgi:AcrR family transcriptional regulator